MKIKQKPPIRIGTSKTTKRFAFFPIILYNADVIWLESYSVLKVWDGNKWKIKNVYQNKG